MFVTINCDIGEGFGQYRMADDAGIMPLIDLANVACGFHASDPMIMNETVTLARQHGVRVGAHPSLPDLQGFGRREMRLMRNEVAAFVRYQIGALKGFLDGAGIPLSHIKPHGALYGMACKEESVAQGICDAADPFDVPLLGLAGTLQEEIYRFRGFEFVSEFYVDLDYADDGTLIIGRGPANVDAQMAAIRALKAVREQAVQTLSGKVLPTSIQTLCVHSDSPVVIDLIQALRGGMEAAAQ